MKLLALDIPDDPATLSTWLDSHLAGLDLRALVEELQSAQMGTSEAHKLDEVLGKSKSQVLAVGLAALPSERLPTFLSQPELLLDLQELVLREGGPYWDDLLKKGPAAQTADDAWPRVAPVPRVAAPRTRWYRRPWVAYVATAAAVLLVVILYDQFVRIPSRPGPAGVGWGWAKKDALPHEKAAPEYLNHLAAAADEWSKKRPDAAVPLAARLSELRQGCAVLILTEHKPLNPETQAWLKERCQAWAKKFDEQLQALEAGQDPLAVRAQVDETVTRLAEVLRKKAKEIAS